MDFFPIFFDIKNKPCLVVGGGEVATRKAGMLMQSGGLIIPQEVILTREHNLRR